MGKVLQVVGNDAFALDPDALPRNIEAEAGLIGALLIDNRLIATAADQLKAEDFSESIHGRVFKAIVKLHEKGRDVNVITLKPVVQNDPGLKELGGPAYLAQLSGDTTVLIGARSFMQQIVEMSVRRKAILAYAAGITSLVDMSEEAVDPEDIIDAVEDEARSSTASIQRTLPRGLADAVQSVRDRSTRRFANGEALGMVCKSIGELNNIVGPLEPETYNVLASRPGGAKTSLSCSAAWGYALAGWGVDYFHMEMSAEQMNMRVVSDISHAMGYPIPHKRIKEADLSGAELYDLERVQAMVDLLPLEFHQMEPGTDVKRIDVEIAKAKRKWAARGKKLGAIFIDYMQLLGASRGGKPLENRFERVTAVSQTLNALKSKHGIAIVALCQLGRSVEDRKDKKPQLNDLKDSGDIEQDADSVTLLYRPEVHLEQERPKNDGDDNRDFIEWRAEYGRVQGKIFLIGAKNRHGKTITAPVRFLPEHYAVRDGRYNEMSAEPIIARDLFTTPEEEF